MSRETRATRRLREVVTESYANRPKADDLYTIQEVEIAGLKATLDLRERDLQACAQRLDEQAAQIAILKEELKVANSRLAICRQFKITYKDWYMSEKIARQKLSQIIRLGMTPERYHELLAIVKEN